MWSIRKGKVLIFLLSLVLGPPKEELPSWVVKRDDNHGEETKVNVTSKAGKREGIQNNMVFSLGMDQRETRKEVCKEGCPSDVRVH